MSSKTKVYISVISIAVIIVIGIGAYFIIANAKKDVSMVSFDGRVTLSLGEHKIGKITEDYHYQRISFTAKDDSIIKLVEESDMVIKKVPSYNSSESYLLLHEGYYFVVRIWKGNGISVMIENAICELVVTGDYTYVPYIAGYDQVYFTKEHENDASKHFREWSRFEFCNNFTELAELYANVSPEYLIGIDPVEKTITLNYCLYNYNGREYLKEIHTDKNLVLKCDNTGVTFLWVDAA